jgi:ribosomal protein L11
VNLQKQQQHEKHQMLPEQQLKQVAIQPQQVHQTFSAHYSAQPQQRVDRLEQQEQHHCQMMAHEVSLTSLVHQQVKVDREHREHREHQVVKVKAEALVYLDYSAQQH